MMRGVLAELWREARKTKNPIAMGFDWGRR